MIDNSAARTLCALALVALPALAGCSVGTLTGLISSDSSDQSPASPATARGGQPTVNVACRWVLAEPGAGCCGVTFVAPPGATEGPVAPEGGCPGKFHASRTWAFEHDAIVIRNHAGETLVQLYMADQGRLEGQSGSGEQVSLTR